MTVVWTRELAKGRGLSEKKDSPTSKSRSWLVRVDDPTTSLGDIKAGTNVTVGEPDPSDVNFICVSLDVRSTDETGMLYEVSAEFEPNPDPEGSSGDDDDPPPGSIDGKTPSWSASSSVSSEPTYLDVNGNTMTNSAGDPLEDLEMERAQFHLQKTEFYLSHAGDDGWVAHSRQFTNAINADVWNGGQPGQWKCQGSSAKLNSDQLGENGTLRYYWEVTWDFAFREDYWVLQPWDIGFNELVDENGDPAPTPYISGGDSGEDIGSGGSEGDDGPCAGGLGRRAILGQDGKPVRQPVALEQGVAKAPCLRPNSLWFQVYKAEDFDPKFGEVFTPQP